MRMAIVGSLALHAVLVVGFVWSAPSRFLSADQAVAPLMGSVIVELVENQDQPGTGWAVNEAAQQPSVPASVATADTLQPQPRQEVARTSPEPEPSTVDRSVVPVAGPAHHQPVVTGAAYATGEPSLSVSSVVVPLSSPTRDDESPWQSAVGAVTMGVPEESPGASAEAWDQFFAAVRAAIEQAKRYPLSARQMGQEDRVAVSFVVLRDGTAEQLRIIEPSRFPVLNQATVSTIQRVAQFPMPPLDEDQRSIRVTVPLVFTLYPEGEAPHRP